MSVLNELREGLGERNLGGAFIKVEIKEEQPDDLRESLGFLAEAEYYDPEVGEEKPTALTSENITGEKSTKRQFTCAYCSHKTFSRISIKKHITNNHSNKQASSCSETSDLEISCIYPIYLPTFSSHFHSGTGHPPSSDESMGIKAFSCPQCKFRSNHSTSVRRHIATVHSKMKRHACTFCDYKTYYLNQVKLHIRAKHTKEMDYHCPHCEYRAVQKRSLDKHIIAIHTDEGRHTCPHCTFLTPYVEYLKLHIRAKHNREKPHPCPDCDYASSYRSHLNKHIMARHKKEKPHACQLCPFRSVQTGDLKRHMDRRHSQKKLHCPFCDYCSPIIDNLKRHVTAAHTKM